MRALSILPGVCLLLLCAVGCGSDRADGTLTEVDRSRLSNAIDLIGDAGVRPGTLADNGLEVRAWIISDNTSAIASGLVRHGEEHNLAAASRAMLERNGLRLWRIPLAELEAFRTGLGGTTVAKQSWFGQVFDWTELHARSLGGLPRGVSVDGGVRRFHSGSFILLIRAWTLTTEDGPSIQFEMVPFYAEADVGGFRRVLNDDDLTGEVFPTLLLQTNLESGFGYILTCERPGVDWFALAGSRSSPESVGGRLTIPEGGDVRGNVGPVGVLGPDIGGPWTIGEALLRGDVEVGSRGVFVLIPRIPDNLFPVELLHDTSGDGENPAGYERTDEVKES